MGSVLELFPSGEVGHAADPESPEEPEDALTIAAENLNRSMAVAFERLVSQYEETVPMPVAPKQLGLLSPELFEKYRQIVPDFPERWLAMFEEEVQRRYPEFPTRRGEWSWEDYLPPMNASLRQLVSAYS